MSNLNDQLFFFNSMANKKNYFSAEVDEAILLYNSSNDSQTRNKVYEKHIHDAIYKIAENLIHRYKFYHLPSDTIKDSIHEIECFVLERLNKIDATKGKPFSYLTKMIYNYLLFSCKEVYKHKINRTPLQEVDNSDISKKRYVTNDYMKDELRTDYYTPEFIGHIRKNLNRHFIGKLDIVTASCILDIIDDRHNLEIFDKKSIFIYVRNIVKISQPKLVKILNKIKELYLQYHQSYLEQFDKVINYNDDMIEDDDIEFNEDFEDLLNDEEIDEISEELTD